MSRKTILITGSSKGLGKELALFFAKKGYNIILHGRNRKNLLEVREKVLGMKVICNVVNGDIKSDKVIDILYKTAKQENISVFVNNAAVLCPNLPLQKMSVRLINDLLITNLIAPIKLTKKIYSFFLKKGSGTIININSISGLKNQELRSIYCASKWGLRGFTDTLRLEAKKHNVRVMGIYPSRIKTKPDFNFGMEARKVAREIFAAYKCSNMDQLLLNTRSKKQKA